MSRSSFISEQSALSRWYGERLRRAPVEHQERLKVKILLHRTVAKLQPQTAETLLRLRGLADNPAFMRLVEIIGGAS